MGEHERAVLDGQRFLSLHGTDKEADEVVFQMGRAEENAGREKQAAELYKRYLPRAKNADHRVEGLVALARIDAKLGDEKGAEEALASAVTLGKHHPRELGPEGKYAAAHARYLQGERVLAKFDKIQIQGDVKQLSKRLKEKAELLKQASAVFLDMVSLGVAEWATAALYQIGHTYESFAKSMKDAPPPSGLSDADKEAYQQQIDEFVVPIEERSLDAYENGWKKATELGIYNQWTQKMRGVARASGTASSIRRDARDWVRDSFGRSERASRRSSKRRSCGGRGERPPNGAGAPAPLLPLPPTAPLPATPPRREGGRGQEVRSRAVCVFVAHSRRWRARRVQRQRERHQSARGDGDHSPAGEPAGGGKMVQGVQAAKDGSRERAIALLREAIALDRGLWEAHYDLGVVLAGAGDLAGSEDELRTASKLAPDAEEVATALGELRRRRGENKDAADALGDFLQDHPNATDARILEVTALRDSGQLDAALKQAQEVLVRKPGDAGALAELALTHLAKGDRDTASLLAKQALDANPKSAAAERATEAHRASRRGTTPSRSRRSRRRLPQLDPQDTTARLNMGVVLLRAGAYAKAEEQYREILAGPPRRCERAGRARGRVSGRGRRAAPEEARRSPRAPRKGARSRSAQRSRPLQSRHSPGGLSQAPCRRQAVLPTLSRRCAERPPVARRRPSITSRR